MDFIARCGTVRPDRSCLKACHIMRRRSTVALARREPPIYCSGEVGKSGHDPFYKPPSATEEDVEIALRQNELKTMIHAAVSSVITLIDERIVSNLESYTMEGRPAPIWAGLPTAIAAVICEHIGKDDV